LQVESDPHRELGVRMQHGIHVQIHVRCLFFSTRL
jgi:hypothetical protein